MQGRKIKPSRHNIFVTLFVKYLSTRYYKWNICDTVHCTMNGLEVWKSMMWKPYLEHDSVLVLNFWESIYKCWLEFNAKFEKPSNYHERDSGESFHKLIRGKTYSVKWIYLWTYSQWNSMNVLNSASVLLFRIHWHVLYLLEKHKKREKKINILWNLHFKWWHT